MLKYHKGFSLIEMLFVLVITSVMLLAISSYFPALIRQYLTLYRYYRLEQNLNHLLWIVEKDLRRAGFGYAEKRGSPVLFSESLTNKTSCLVIVYDFNANGQIELNQSAYSEAFRYRLHQANLEQSRGMRDCNGTGWENLNDPNEIQVTSFNLKILKTTQAGSYFIVKIQGNWRNSEYINQTKARVIYANNINAI